MNGRVRAYSQAPDGRVRVYRARTPTPVNPEHIVCTCGRDCRPQIAETTNVYSKRANQRRQVRKAADIGVLRVPAIQVSKCLLGPLYPMSLGHQALRSRFNTFFARRGGTTTTPPRLAQKVLKSSAERLNPLGSPCARYRAEYALRKYVLSTE